MLILLKSIPIVQELYTSIMNDFENSYNLILKESHSTDQCQLITSSLIDKQQQDKNEYKLTIKQAETIYLFNLCILTELGSSKNNLICVSV